jgi:heme/copper-type cytochrome/quinol oxidase subunit 1
MPRRIPEYALSYLPLNVVSSIGATISTIGVFFFCIMLFNAKDFK